MNTDQLYCMQGLIDVIQIAVDAGASKDVTARALTCVSNYMETILTAESKEG